jgi:hypothetical protein
MSFRVIARRAGFTLLLLGSVRVAAGAPGPLTTLGPGFDSAAYSGQLKSTVFATGLSFPSSMQSYAGGILVGTTSGGPIFSTATSGHLLLLTDTNNDGAADQQVDLTPAGGLPGGVTSVRQAGSLIFVMSTSAPTGPVISVLQQGATQTSPFVSVGSVSLAYSDANWEHTSYALATRPTPGQPGSTDLFFGLGSRADVTSDAGNFGVYHAMITTNGGATGLSNVTLLPESIYKATVSATGPGASFSAPVQVAAGLRNAAGIAIQPGSGDLYFEDNGMDGSASNGHPPDKFGNAAYSLDTLHKITRADIGVNVPGTNFASDFYENTPPTPAVHGSPDSIAHFAPFGPFDAGDLNASPNESEGANEIAFAPASFPSALSNGIFIGFHGELDSAGAPDPATGAGNDENPVVFYDLGTGTYWHFIGTAEPNVGHLDGLLATSDTLYLSDLAAGGIGGPDFNTGTIYAITAVPEPAIVSLLLLPSLLLRRSSFRRR